jgi:DNA primase
VIKKAARVPGMSLRQPTCSPSGSVGVMQNNIIQIKNQINLLHFIQNLGINLKKYDREYVGQCPFHEDEKSTFTVNPEAGLWYCFQCDMGGDIIKFVQLYNRLSQEEAINKLLQHPLTDKVYGTNELKLLKQVFEYYAKTFNEKRDGIDFLKKSGLSESFIYQAFRFGFSDGTLPYILNSEDKEQLMKLGILTKNEQEYFLNQLVYPLYDRNKNIVNLGGLHITNKISKYLHKQKGMFCRPKGTNLLILTFGILDTLTFYQCGYFNTILLNGIDQLSSEVIEYLRENRITQSILCLNKKRIHDLSLNTLLEQIKEIAISVKIAQFPANITAHEFYKEGGTEKIDRILQPIRKELIQSENHQIHPEEKSIEGGFLFEFPIPPENRQKRAYRILGMNLSGLDRLRVSLKVSWQKNFHIDTLDLYVSRSRNHFIETAGKLLKISPLELSREINCIIERLESTRLKLLQDKKEPVLYDMSNDELKEAQNFLKSPSIIEEIRKDFESCGYIGEESVRLFGYLALISRFLKQPLGILIVSRSAAGKSFLQDTLCRFVAPEDLKKYTRITGQSLFYRKKNALKHKVLSIAEEKGAEDAIYSIRTLQSEQSLTLAVTITDPKSGEKRSEEYQVEGPVVIIITTTNPEALDYETRSRFVILTIDESREQTRRILKNQRHSDSLEDILMEQKTEYIYRKHHNAQRLLKEYMDKGLQIVNPFYNHLTYPDTHLEMRREQKKYLTLIKSITCLKLFQRRIKSVKPKNTNPLKYIEVKANDIELANNLAAEILGRSLDELSPPARNLLRAIKQMVNEYNCYRHGEDEFLFTRKEICKYTGWSYWQIRPHLEQLVELEYLWQHTGRQGKRHQYELLWDGQGETGDRFLSGLIKADKLKTLRI